MSDSRGGVRAWTVVIAASLFFFYVFIQINMFNTIGSYFISKYQLKGGAALGNFSAMFLYADVIFLLPVGILIDKISTKKILMYGISLSIIGLLGLTLSNVLWLALSFRFVAGSSAAIAFIACLKLAAHWFPTHKLGFVIGIVVTLAMLGGVMAQTPLALLYNSFGGFTALCSIVVLGVVILIIIAILVKDSPTSISCEDEVPHEEVLPLWASTLKVLSNGQNWKAGLYTGLVNLPIMVLGAVWGSSYLENSYGLTSLQAPSVISMIFIGTIIGAPVIGWFSDLIHNRKFPMITGAILSLITVIVIIFSDNLSVTMLYLLFFLLGIFTSSQTLGYPVIAESNDIKYNGTANGIASLLIIGTGAVSQPLFGWLLQVFSKGSAAGIVDYSYISFKYAMISLPICFIVALILAILLRETGKRKSAV